ncbi:GNAT family N-acetyltransferase [Bernardetia sp. OM2101]|uniref:GNAT family N-acetyltransferase n=1 Tax=Bernardetia sp. OM2101 TaxID=3344876 RepID=UPI0035CF44DA
MNTIQENIANLTSLWITASSFFKGHYVQDEINSCYVLDSQWPNKIWLNNEDEIKIEDLSKITELINLNSSKLTFSYFDKKPSNDNDLIINNGFTKKGRQYGMSLELNHLFDVSIPLTLKKVVNSVDAKIWCTTFEKCFGYLISEETLNKTYHKINYFIIYSQDEVVGTILLHFTRKTVGIHSLGILPVMRGKGFANQIMYQVLNESISLGMSLATLQASEMAKKMYQQIGFSIEFLIQHYQLEKIIHLL